MSARALHGHTSQAACPYSPQRHGRWRATRGTSCSKQTGPGPAIPQRPMPWGQSATQGPRQGHTAALRPRDAPTLRSTPRTPEKGAPWRPPNGRLSGKGWARSGASSGPQGQGRPVSTLNLTDPSAPCSPAWTPSSTSSPSLQTPGSHRPSQVGLTPPADAQACSGARAQQGVPDREGGISAPQVTLPWSSLVSRKPHAAQRRAGDASKKHGAWFCQLWLY